MLKKILLWTITSLSLLWGLATLGLWIMPRSFAPYPDPTPALQRIPIPAGLPAPVARFYQVIAGDSIPVVRTAVISGRGHFRLGPVRFPGRLRFTHEAGQSYRHYMETTFFGRPIMKVDEHFLAGKGRLNLPFGLIEHEPQVDAAANLGLWAESVHLPAIFLTDPRVRWEPIDQHRASLVVPGPEGEERFTVTFDLETGLLLRMETLRWQNAGDTRKRRWVCEAFQWKRYHGVLLPSVITATWEGEKAPWLVATVEEIVYNVDVSRYIRATGP